MSSPIKWSAGAVSRGNILSTELNSLAGTAGTRTNASTTAIDNTTNLDKYGYVKLSVTFASAPSATAYCSLRMITALDGTNYADGSSTVDPGMDTEVLVIPILASTSAQKKEVGPFLLPPAKMKFILVNQTGQSFPASGSTLELFTANDAVG
jgi:hypothetical protein